MTRMTLISDKTITIGPISIIFDFFQSSWCVFCLRGISICWRGFWDNTRPDPETIWVNFKWWYIHGYWSDFNTFLCFSKFMIRILLTWNFRFADVDFETTPDQIRKLHELSALWWHAFLIDLYFLEVDKTHLFHVSTLLMWILRHC